MNASWTLNIRLVTETGKVCGERTRTLPALFVLRKRMFFLETWVFFFRNADVFLRNMALGQSSRAFLQCS